jgi:hypothetical protein
MLAALQAVKHANVGKLLSGLWKGTKNVAARDGMKKWVWPSIGAGGWDYALNADQYGEHIPMRLALGGLNLALLQRGIAKNQLSEALALIPTKDLAVQAGLRLPQFATAMSQMGEGAVRPPPAPPAPSSTTVNAGENWLQTLGNSVKENPWTAAGAGTLGIAGLAGLAHLMGGGKAPAITPPAEQSGRIRVTLPTRRRGDAETTVELPVEQMGMSEGLMRRLQRDVRSRLRTETNERTRKVNLSEEERQRRREMLLARLRPSIL